MNAPQLTGNVNKNTTLLGIIILRSTEMRRNGKTTVMISVQDDAACYATTET